MSVRWWVSVTLFGALVAVPQVALAQLTATASQTIRQGAGGYLGIASEEDRFAAALAVGDFDGDGWDDLAVGVPGETVGAVGAGAVQILYGSPGGITSVGNTILTQSTAGVPGSSEAADGFGTALAAFDINCDGFDDLAVGAPGENIGSVSDAGGVWILYGSASGLIGTDAQAFGQNDWDPLESPEASDRFGSALVGRSGVSGVDSAGELFIGAPGEGVTFGSFGEQGAVLSIRHSCIQPRGSAFADEVVSQQSTGVSGTSEDGDLFGLTLALGDFDGNSLPDLAVGAPGESLTLAEVGIVQVFPDVDLADPSNESQWSQDVAGILDVAEEGDGFGRSLTVGDFDHDGFDDLVVGVPEEGTDGFVESGAVHVIYGSAGGLTATGDQFFTQSGAVLGDPGPADNFGTAVAAGDFDGDGTDDLAIGVLLDSPGGSVNVLYGQISAGLGFERQQSWNQDSAGIGDSAEHNDRFGGTLASGDFNGDGREDLAIGAPSETLGTVFNAGLLHILYGADDGILGEVGFASAAVRVEVEDNRLVTLSVQRLGAANLPLTVGHRLRSGSNPATLGVDYAYTPGTLSWPAGDLGVRAISIAINEDDEFEGTEFVYLELFDPSTATTLGTVFRATVQINDDDPNPHVFSDGFETGTTAAWSQTVGGA